jgi:hypothetical protein
MRRRFAAATLVALAAALTLACSSGDAPRTAPEPPTEVLERPARLPWGDTIAARVGTLSAHIHDQLQGSYGAVVERHYVGRDPAAVAGLEQWYSSRLQAGWKREPLSLAPEEHGFAFMAGKRALAVGWLDRLPDGRIPVVLMRYGEHR